MTTEFLSEFCCISSFACCVIGLRQGGAPTYMWIHSKPRSFALPSCLRRCSPLFSLLSKISAVTSTSSRLGIAFTALLVLRRGVGASPCSGLSWRPLFVVLSPWAGSRSRLVLALGLRRAVAPRKGNCWVRIDLAILGLLAQAIVIEIRNASLDFNCH